MHSIVSQVLSDLELSKMCDWENFEQKVVSQKNLQFPSFFMNEEIKIEEWKNIPIPLTDSIKTIMRTFLNLENLWVFLCKEVKNRFYSTVKKIYSFQQECKRVEHQNKKDFKDERAKNSLFQKSIEDLYKESTMKHEI